MTTRGAAIAIASSSSCYYCNCSSSFCPSYSSSSSYKLNILTTTIQYPLSSFSSIGGGGGGGGPRQQNQRFTKSKSKRNAAAAAKIDTHALLFSSSKLGNQRRITSSNAAAVHHHHLFQTIKSKHIPNPTARGTIASSSSSPPSQEKEEEEFRVLTALTTKYNDIVIVETSTSRILLLDSTHNVHSIFNLQKENGGDDHNHLWTNSYWDEFASLPAIVPQGPIALLGLGGGTSARLMLHLCPSLNIHAWEIDSILIDKSREYLGLSDLEKCTQVGGLLVVHVGDALSPLASIPGGFSGIVVDLFSNGKVLPQLQEVTTWLELNNKLMSHGRIMVNCGGADIETTEFKDRRTHHSSSSDDGLWVHNSTIKALCKAFPGKLSWKKMGGNHGGNYLALTGPFPDLDEWSTSVPEKLSTSVKSWQPCHISA